LSFEHFTDGFECKHPKAAGKQLRLYEDEGIYQNYLYNCYKMFAVGGYWWYHHKSLMMDLG